MSVPVSNQPTITRFAPSPTGYLHLGHAYAALRAWEEAQAAQGQFILRIEDIDPDRCRPEFTAAIPKDMAWLGQGLEQWHWPTPIRYQSHHMADYQQALDQLSRMGVLYPCFCTRKHIQEEIRAAVAAPHGPDGPLYPGICKKLTPKESLARIAAGEPHALRLDNARAITRTGRLFWHEYGETRHQARPELYGDVVLARKDIPASYHLCCVVDDHLQKISLVTRGNDLKSATHLHRLLQALLGFHPPSYRHHRLMTDDHGHRLTKRDQAISLRFLRGSGVSPADVRNRIKNHLSSIK